MILYRPILINKDFFSFLLDDQTLSLICNNFRFILLVLGSGNAVTQTVYKTEAIDLKPGND